jgi:hypothetical protein
VLGTKEKKRVDFAMAPTIVPGETVADPVGEVVGERKETEKEVVPVSFGGALMYEEGNVGSSTARC